MRTDNKQRQKSFQINFTLIIIGYFLLRIALFEYKRFKYSHGRPLLLDDLTIQCYF